MLPMQTNSRRITADKDERRGPGSAGRERFLDEPVRRARSPGARQARVRRPARHRAVRAPRGGHGGRDPRRVERLERESLRTRRAAVAALERSTRSPISNLACRSGAGSAAARAQPISGATDGRRARADDGASTIEIREIEPLEQSIDRAAFGDLEPRTRPRQPIRRERPECLYPHAAAPRRPAAGRRAADEEVEHRRPVRGTRQHADDEAHRPKPLRSRARLRRSDRHRVRRRARTAARRRRQGPARPRAAVRRDDGDAFRLPDAQVQDPLRPGQALPHVGKLHYYTEDSAPENYLVLRSKLGPQRRRVAEHPRAAAAERQQGLGARPRAAQAHRHDRVRDRQERASEGRLFKDGQRDLAPRASASARPARRRRRAASGSASA